MDEEKTNSDTKVESASTTSRRTFLASSAVLAMGRLTGDPLAEVGLVSPESGPPVPQGTGGITQQTIAEAEKIHGLTYTADEREQIVQSIGNQVDQVKQLRDVPRELNLQPAITFDPRLPGVSYATQENHLELAAEEPTPLPDSEADVAYASVRSQAHWIRIGQITSRRLTEIYLSRIERIAPELYCYITVARDLALSQADESDRELADGRYRGELHGIPYGIKDCFDTAGVATTWGAIPYRDRVPDQDATIVTMLRDAGAGSRPRPGASDLRSRR